MTPAPTLAELVTASSGSGLLAPESFPKIATAMLEADYDSPSLRVLAGVDLSPFDFRDAIDLLNRSVVKLALPIQPTDRRLTLAAALISFQCVSGTLRPRMVTKRYYLLAVAEDYPENPPEIIEFFLLDDEWDSIPWKSDEMDEQIKGRAAELLQRLGLESWTPPKAILDGLLH
jgi:hypothetical protein